MGSAGPSARACGPRRRCRSSRGLRAPQLKSSISNLSPILQQNDQTLEGSFSAVSTATIATKQSFCRVFRDLQDLQSFAPLRSQNFNKNSSNFFSKRKSKKMQILNLERCKGVVLLQFPKNAEKMSIWLLSQLSIQPRTDLLKFGEIE